MGRAVKEKLPGGAGFIRYPTRRTWGLAMLYSHTHRLAFAHYPKTAGSAISVWFRRTFPDAMEVDPTQPHIDVRRALGHLAGWGSWPAFGRRARRAPARATAWSGDPLAVRRVRVVGVVRSPLEMLVSLYEFWRRLETHPAPGNRLITTARTGTFRQFVEVAICRRRLPNYASFFDVDGPARSRTRLVHFGAVEAGLQHVLDEFGIPVRVQLERRNHAPVACWPLDDYRREAGPLMPQVHRRFAWYYRNEPFFSRGMTEEPVARAA